MRPNGLPIIAAVLLVGAQIALVRLAPAYTGPRPTAIAEVLPLIVLLALPGALALLAVPRLTRLAPTPLAMAVMLGCGLLMRVVWLGAPAPLEDDFYRYLWDGAMLAHGLDPYALAPDEVTSAADLGSTLAALRVAGASTLARINFPDLETIYPGVAQLAFALAHVLAPWSLDGLRSVLLASDAVTVALLVMTLRRIGRSPLLAALYWMNPLVVFTTIATAHVDALLVPFLLGTVLLLAARRPVGSSALLALAVGVKVWPLLLAPLLAAEMARRRLALVAPAVAFSIIIAAALGPLLAASLEPESGLATYSGSWVNNNGPFSWASLGVRHLLADSEAAQLALRLAMAGVAGCAALLCAARPAAGLDDLLRRVMAVGATVFYFSPAQFPWYALWFLPFAAATAYRPLLLASVTLTAYYLFFPLWESGRGNTFLYGVSFMHSWPVWAWLAWDQRQRLRGWLREGRMALRGSRHV